MNQNRFFFIILIALGAMATEIRPSEPLEYGATILLRSPHYQAKAERAYIATRFAKAAIGYKTGYPVGFSTRDAFDGWKIRSTEGKGGSIRYGDKISLEFQGSYKDAKGGSSKGHYLGTDDHDDVNTTRTEAGPWETWKLIKPNQEQSKDVINFNDPVALKSNFNKYLTAEDNYREASSNRTKLGPWEIWAFVQK